jgi:diguanylate cyclase (GGDEF)-like protein
LEELPDGRFGYAAVNDGYARLLGMARQKLVGRGVEQSVAPLRSEELRSYLETSSPSSQPLELEAPVEGDGPLTWIRHIFLPVTPTATGKARILAVAVHAARLSSLRRPVGEVDALTGLTGPKSFFAMLEQEVDRSLRYRRPLSILRMDIDKLHSINEEFGHSVGDEVFRLLSKVLPPLFRNSDRLGRWTEDEFAALLPETGAEEAMRVAERVCTKVTEAKVPGAFAVVLTVSVGISELGPSVFTGEALLRVAKEALMKVRAKGGNGASRI